MLLLYLNVGIASNIPAPKPGCKSSQTSQSPRGFFRRKIIEFCLSYFSWQVVFALGLTNSTDPDLKDYGLYIDYYLN